MCFLIYPFSNQLVVGLDLVTSGYNKAIDFCTLLLVIKISVTFK